MIKTLKLINTPLDTWGVRGKIPSAKPEIDSAIDTPNRHPVGGRLGFP
jgi:hypothetical protein